MKQLTLQVRQLNTVRVCNYDVSNPGRSKIHGCRRAKPAGTDNQCARSQQSFLPVDIDLRQQDLATVAKQLRVVHRGKQSRLLQVTAQVFRSMVLTAVRAAQVAAN